MRDADVAMYRAKADGKGRHAVFDARMHEQVMRRLDMETDLRHAIEARRARGRLPADRAGGDGPDRRLRGAVPLAAARDGGAIEPAEFVPIAEETGLIVAARAPRARDGVPRSSPSGARCRAARGSRSASTSPTASCSEPDFAVELAAVLARDRAGPARAAPGGPRARPRARRRGDAARRSPTCCETLGVRWQIDDFGTGASSLHLLHRFPGDAVKIFGPLVSGMGHDGGSFEIVKAIVELAHNLGLEVIAEGVETAGQLEHLRVLGCEFAQGFHVSRRRWRRRTRAPCWRRARWSARSR